MRDITEIQFQIYTFLSHLIFPMALIWLFTTIILFFLFRNLTEMDLTGIILPI